MKYFLTTIFVLSLWPLSIQALTLVEVKAGSERINAIEGTLVLPADVVVEKIYTGESSVLIWIAEPVWDNANKTVSFAGLSPGGFSGTAPLFALELTAGEARVAGGRLTGYRNDGAGTAIELEYSLRFKGTVSDHEPPEPFPITVTRSPEVFEGHHFIVFVTQDKGTGIERFEYAATWFWKPRESDWNRVQSPHKLSGIEKFQRLHVRAIDQEGNFLAVSTGGPYRLLTLAFGFIIVVCVALFITRSLSLPSSPSFPQ